MNKINYSRYQELVENQIGGFNYMMYKPRQLNEKQLCWICYNKGIHYTTACKRILSYRRDMYDCGSIIKRLEESENER